MGLLGFIDTTFILTLGIVLLICGGIMIYCYRRLNALENGLIQQGRVMQEFITNYNLTTQLDNNRNNDNNDNNYQSEMINQVLSGNILGVNPDIREKIVVSDDDMSDEEDEDDMVSDYISEDESNIVEIKKESINHDTGNDSDSDSDSERIIENLTIDNDMSDVLDNLNIENIPDVEMMMSPDLSSLIVSKLDVSSIGDLDITASEDKSSKMIPISDTDGLDTSKKNPNRLKVDELRELVVNKNLVSNDEAQKLKKGELVRLLE
jgi:hypothetical protein